MPWLLLGFLILSTLSLQAAATCNTMPILAGASDDHTYFNATDLLSNGDFVVGGYTKSQALLSTDPGNEYYGILISANFDGRPYF